MEAVKEVLAVTENIPGDRHKAAHSIKAAGSHFLPLKRPIVTPEGAVKGY